MLAGIDGAVAVAAGGNSDVGTSLALKSDGTVWVWGNNAKTPLQIQGFSNVASINVAVGGSRYFGVKSDGSVWSSRCDSASGSPVCTGESSMKIPGLSRVLAVSGGAAHTIALTSDGTVWASGNNASAELGDGTIINRSLPTEVPGLSGVTVAIAGGRFSLALKVDGTVWAWGSTNGGVLANSLISNSSTQVTFNAYASSSPNQISGLTGIVAIAPGWDHALAIKSGGSVWSWGANYYGELGNGTVSGSGGPAQVPGLSSIVAIAAGGQGQSFAIKSDGSLWAWGKNDLGQLGDGTKANRSSPILVSGLNNVVSVAADWSATLAVCSDGSVWQWGNNVLSPVRIVPSGIKAVALSGDDFHALKDDGTVLAWGRNAYGQLGVGSQSIAQTPTKVKDVKSAVSIAMGGSHTLVARSDGSVYAYGNNGNAQLGDGTLAQKSAPVLVVNPHAHDFLNLASETLVDAPKEYRVSFFVNSSGEVSSTSATVLSTASFNPSDVGKSGGMFVTALVPNGSLGTLLVAQSGSTPLIAKGPQPTMAAAVASNGFTLIQLTSAGWKTVVNGQLIPYSSGVLGDQLAAQTILNGTDTTNLKGAEFCFGYGTSAQDMIDNGNIRAVANIPGAITPSTCAVGTMLSSSIVVKPGWNLLGNPIKQTMFVSEKFGDATKISSVWKWDSAKANWQFYTPSMSSSDLLAYATGQNYAVLSEISPGEGYWVNAKVQADIGIVSGSAVYLRQSSLASGWNLVSTASPISAKDFNLTLSTMPPTSGQVPINMTSLWAWDNTRSNWYFYAPSLEAQSGAALFDYISSKGYEDFTSTGKTLGNGVGVWVNRP
jgi:alpha-tubulin suppressor-like RCC1 family protein